MQIPTHYDAVTLNHFLCILQILMVASEIILDPSTICHEMHLCSPANSTDSTPTNDLLLSQTLPNLIRNLSQKSSIGTGHCKSPASRLRREQSNSTFHGDERHLHHTVSINGKDEPHTKEPLSITFLQIGDIHLDHMYAEVNS